MKEIIVMHDSLMLIVLRRTSEDASRSISIRAVTLRHTGYWQYADGWLLAQIRCVNEEIIPMLILVACHIAALQHSVRTWRTMSTDKADYSERGSG